MYFKIICVATFSTLLNLTVKAQYYYKDIMSNKQAIAEKNILQEQKIRTVKVHSFEPNGAESEGFFCEKKIAKNYKKIEIFTRSYVTSKSIQTTLFNEKGLLIQSSDSSDLNASNTFFAYDNNNNVTSIINYSHSTDDDFTTALVEAHLYTYDKQNKPTQMILVKNKKDSLLVTFKTYEKGNVTDEIEEKENGRHYYYYYDQKNRLTDIVKFNVVKNKLLPDIIFEYNYSGQIAQMSTIEEGVASAYITWKYVYNDGLKIIEKCYEQGKTLLGYVEYEYD